MKNYRLRKRIPAHKSLARPGPIHSIVSRSHLIDTLEKSASLFGVSLNIESAFILFARRTIVHLSNPFRGLLFSPLCSSVRCLIHRLLRSSDVSVFLSFQPLSRSRISSLHSSYIKRLGKAATHKYPYTVYKSQHLRRISHQVEYINPAGPRGFHVFSGTHRLFPFYYLSSING